MKQNIYDNETFFIGYSKIRENENNANNLFEKPALFSLLPSACIFSIAALSAGFLISSAGTALFSTFKLLSLILI